MLLGIYLLDASESVNFLKIVRNDEHNFHLHDLYLLKFSWEEPSFLTLKFCRHFYKVLRTVQKILIMIGTTVTSIFHNFSISYSTRPLPFYISHHFSPSALLYENVIYKGENGKWCFNFHNNYHLLHF